VKGRPKLISIVGDQNRIDLNALKEFGAVTEVSLSDMFVD
jgi:hypothetical protein